MFFENAFWSKVLLFVGAGPQFGEESVNCAM